MDFPSKLLSHVIDEISRLPGIGEKSALRIAMFLLRKDKKQVEHFCSSLSDFRNNICYCEECFSICDEKICNICKNMRRNRALLCIVPNTIDMIAIENTAYFKGLYHVLGGIISPIDGVGAEDVHISQLIERLKKGGFKEVIFALPSTIEGNTTMNFISEQIKPLSQPITISSIARGVPIGGELEYTDEVTLTESLIERREIH